MNNIILYLTNEHIFLIFIGLLALEIFLLIKIGGEIGALNTLALIFLTAIMGFTMLEFKALKL